MRREAKVKVYRSDLSVTLKSNKGILRDKKMSQALTAGKALLGWEVEFNSQNQSRMRDEGIVLFKNPAQTT